MCRQKLPLTLEGSLIKQTKRRFAFTYGSKRQHGWDVSIRIAIIYAHVSVWMSASQIIQVDDLISRLIK